MSKTGAVRRLHASASRLVTTVGLSASRHGRNLPFLLCAIFLLGSSRLQAQERSLCAKEQLFEYGCDFFDEDGHQGPSFVPLLKPPELKLYRDGTIVFERDERFYLGILNEKALERIEERLARSPLLRHTELLRDVSGEVPLMHGGVCYFAYLDGDKRVIVAVLVIPTGGEWQRIVRAIRKRLPPPSQLYRPSKIRIGVTKVPPRDWPEWPHAESLDLEEATRATSVELTEPRTIEYFFTHRPAAASWYLNQDGAGYKITLLEVHGWYEPYDVEKTIWNLVGRESTPH